MEVKSARQQELISIVERTGRRHRNERKGRRNTNGPNNIPGAASMKLSDVAVEDVAWNITPLIERTAWHSAMRYAMRMRYESYVEHRSLISYCEEDTIVKACSRYRISPCASTMGNRI